MSAFKLLRTFAALAALTALAGTATAEPVTVAWDPNPAEEGVTGYLLYYGTASRAESSFAGYDVEIDVGATTQYTVDLPDPATTYYLAVIAYNGAGLRSDYSDEVARAATGVPVTHTVTLSAGAGGSVSPSGTVTVDRGGTLAVTISADSGCAVNDVLVDGTSVGAVASYTFADVTGDHTLSATFQLLDPADSDGDELPDAWENQYFAGLGAAPGGDADDDGLTNLQEYLAGTDPTVADVDPALTPSVSAPVSGGIVATRSVDLAVDNPIHDPGESITYQFELALQADMTDGIASTSGLGEGDGGVTSWSVPQDLADQTRYYWRARAVAGSAASEWTPVSTFYVDTAAQPTTTELVTAEYVPATEDVSVDILDPLSPAEGLGIDVGAGTLPYDFILTVATVSNPPPAVRAARLAGATMELGPHGRPFDAPVTVLLPYDDQTLAEAGVTTGADLDVLTYNTETLRWEVVPGTVHDPMGRRVIAQVSHFSMYSLGVAGADTPTTLQGSSSGGGGGGCFIGSLW